MLWRRRSSACRTTYSARTCARWCAYAAAPRPSSSTRCERSSPTDLPTTSSRAASWCATHRCRAPACTRSTRRRCWRRWSPPVRLLELGPRVGHDVLDLGRAQIVLERWHAGSAVPDERDLLLGVGEVRRDHTGQLR